MLNKNYSIIKYIKKVWYNSQNINNILINE